MELELDLDDSTLELQFFCAKGDGLVLVFSQVWAIFLQEILANVWGCFIAGFASDFRCEQGCFEVLFFGFSD